MNNNVLVRKDSILGGGETLVFDADHWHEYPDGALEVVDEFGNIVASFRPHRWDHVYLEEKLVEIRRGKD